MNSKLEQIGTVHADENGFYIRLEKEYIPAFTRLEGYSYIQLLYWFDKCDNECSMSKLTERNPHQRKVKERNEENKKKVI